MKAVHLNDAFIYSNLGWERSVDMRTALGGYCFTRYRVFMDWSRIQTYDRMNVIAKKEGQLTKWAN